MEGRSEVCEVQVLLFGKLEWNWGKSEGQKKKGSNHATDMCLDMFLENY